MVSAVDRKLLRDLGRLKGQLVTIALVVSCGIASYVVMATTYGSLLYSKSAYYERTRFADAFVQLKRAPEAVARRAAELPGVARVSARVVQPVSVPMDALPEPANGTVVSIPEQGKPALNDIHLQGGRWPERGDEILLLQSFADVHGLEPGDRLPAVINGTRRELRIVGTALSPEYVFVMAPGDITVDDKRNAVIWMFREAVAAAFNMEGAFNDLTLALRPGANRLAVLDQLDRLLEPYGGMGAVGRDKQMSNFMLNGELAQLEAMATVVPVIFLAVAAFLLHVVLSRLVGLQRVQIAVLKAVGYGNRAVALHYLKLVVLIVLVGGVIGVALGAWLGREMTEMYARFFKFPGLAYRLDWRVVLTSALISLAAALVGALGAARQVSRLPPAEAMRPPAPATYKRTILERLGLFRILGPASRMVVREIERRPLRTLLSSFGIALAVAIVVVGRFWGDAVEFLIDVQFHRAMREDLSVSFNQPLPERAVREIAHVPGVLYAEGMRLVPVRFRVGHRYRDSAIWGFPDEPELRRVLDQYGDEVPLPSDGLLLTAKLGEVLGVGPGDRVKVEVREGDRPKLWVPVAGLVDESFGLQGHMRLSALRKLLGEERTVSMALLRIDPAESEAVHRRLKLLPQVASVTRRDNVRERFNETSADMLKVFTFVLTLFAAIIAVGVVYNNARVALSMRSRDLASLRVLGFTRAEISAILLGELGVQVLLAVPVGMLIGTWLSSAMMATVDPETYRFPVIISTRTYAFAATVALGSGLVSALLVRRRLDRLDLIGVLKTRE